MTTLNPGWLGDALRAGACGIYPRHADQPRKPMTTGLPAALRAYASGLYALEAGVELLTMALTSYS